MGGAGRPVSDIDRAEGNALDIDGAEGNASGIEWAEGNASEINGPARLAYSPTFLLAFIILLLFQTPLTAQLTGTVLDAKRKKPLDNVTLSLLPGSQLYDTQKGGRFRFDSLSPGTYRLTATSPDGRFDAQSLQIAYSGGAQEIKFPIQNISYRLATQTITDEYGGSAYLRSIEGVALYATKKTELIRPDSLLANTAANNARRLFVRVPGLNIWESDAGGLQLGIGGRGLSPNRTSNFNVRQNGYDIAGDALGYPESYYTPPAEAIERIEVVRGAASLQYGTQFGGLVNFLLKNGPEDKPFALTTRQTVGSYGFFNTFNSVGGTVANDKINYYGLIQHRRGNGWRINSGFEQTTGYISLSAKLSARVRLGVEYTRMGYLAQQAGGLTDAMYESGFQGSIRDRNWFKVGWNLGAVTADIELSEKTRINIRNFGLIGSREALGFLGQINRVDDLGNRDLINGEFNNLGNETRLLHRYEIKDRPAALLAGVRLYRGDTRMQQGFASDSSDADFNYLNPNNPGQSEFTFPSINLAGFAEHLFNLTDRFSITPGVRFEHVTTSSNGYYFQRAYDLAGNLILEERLDEQKDLSRNFLLMGLGAGYRTGKASEVYANWSQNYRAITFTDLRVLNPNFRVDENLRDERGFNMDLGWRGQANDWFSYDFSAFLLRYNDRIGNVLKTDTVDFNLYRFRTNIADALNLGVEWYAEADLARAIFKAEKTRFSLFSNFSFIRAKYTDSEEPAFDGKDVELVPPVAIKAGFNFKRGAWRGNAQYSYTAGHFSDATNADRSPTSVEGFIPSYSLVDISAGWEKKWEHFRLEAEAGVQNLLNEYYFTRRATGYPGPGIIPSDLRNIYFSVGLRL